MSNDIGSVKGINCNSTSLNTQTGAGTQKPSMTSGNSSPGGTKPPRKPDGNVPMPK